WPVARGARGSLARSLELLVPESRDRATAGRRIAERSLRAREAAHRPLVAGVRRRLHRSGHAWLGRARARLPCARARVRARSAARRPNRRRDSAALDAGGRTGHARGLRPGPPDASVVRMTLRAPC